MKLETKIELENDIWRGVLRQSRQLGFRPDQFVQTAVEKVVRAAESSAARGLDAEEETPGGA